MSSSKSNQLICLKHIICGHISANGCSCYPSWQYNYFTALIMNYRSDVIAHASSEHLCPHILSHCSAVFLSKGKKLAILIYITQNSSIRCLGCLLTITALNWVFHRCFSKQGDDCVDSFMFLEIQTCVSMPLYIFHKRGYSNTNISSHS